MQLRTGNPGIQIYRLQAAGYRLLATGYKLKGCAADNGKSWETDLRATGCRSQATDCDDFWKRINEHVLCSNHIFGNCNASSEGGIGGCCQGKYQDTMYILYLETTNFCDSEAHETYGFCKAELYR